MGLVAAVPGRAAAYVRYRSNSACPYGWPARTVAISEFPEGLPDLDEGVIANAVTQAAQAWSSTGSSEKLASCTDLSLQVTAMSLGDPSPAAKYDHLNNVMFRSTKWCLDPATSASAIDSCDPYSLAITSVFARLWGEILDADIEVNAVNFRWGDLVESPSDGQTQDLQNALTHEMGHLIGLDHTCLSVPRKLRPVDETGTPVLDCGDPDLPDSARLATMYASADPGDLSKRSLEPDDEQAVCDAYPREQPDPLACQAPDRDSGCALAGDGSASANARAPLEAGWALLAGAALAALVGWSRMRQARSRQR